MMLALPQIQGIAISSFLLALPQIQRIAISTFLLAYFTGPGPSLLLLSAAPYP